MKLYACFLRNLIDNWMNCSTEHVFIDIHDKPISELFDQISQKQPLPIVRDS